jgi:hypothetical protein
MQCACAVHRAGDEANEGDEERECPDLAIDAPLSVTFEVR